MGYRYNIVDVLPFRQGHGKIRVSVIGNQPVGNETGPFIIRHADLPSRPTSISAGAADDDDAAPVGAYITLSGGQAGSWSMVQWLAEDGHWYDVVGWGSSDVSGVTW